MLAGGTPLREQIGQAVRNRQKLPAKISKKLHPRALRRQV